MYKKITLIFLGLLSSGIIWASDDDDPMAIRCQTPNNSAPALVLVELGRFRSNEFTSSDEDEDEANFKYLDVSSKSTHQSFPPLTIERDRQMEQCSAALSAEKELTANQTKHPQEQPKDEEVLAAQKREEEYLKRSKEFRQRVEEFNEKCNAKYQSKQGEYKLEQKEDDWDEDREGRMLLDELGLLQELDINIFKNAS